MKVICERCGGDEFIYMVDAIIVAPATIGFKLSKQNLRKKDVYIQRVDWDTRTFICKKCNKVDSDIRTGYIKALRDDGDALRARLRELGEEVMDFDYQS